MHRIIAAGLAACVGLAVWNARAELPPPDVVQPDVLMRGVTGVEALTIDYALADKNR